MTPGIITQRRGGVTYSDEGAPSPVPRETPVSANAIHRALEALGRDIEQRDAEIEHYRRLLAAERAARHAAETRACRAERALAQYAPTVALDLPPATRPDLYAIAGIEGAA